MWRRRDSSGVILSRSIEARTRWPKEVRRVRAAAFPGGVWPHANGRTWHMVVAAVDGRVAGFVMLHIYDEGDVDLNDLAVDPAHQRRGIGYAMCADAVEWMRELGCNEIGGLPVSPGSVAIFRRLGFERSDRAPGLVLTL
jgi:GNAT superfamily N-acetyltransferase